MRQAELLAFQSIACALTPSSLPSPGASLPPWSRRPNCEDTVYQVTTGRHPSVAAQRLASFNNLRRKLRTSMCFLVSISAD
jgi:hypothetical protein